MTVLNSPREFHRAAESLFCGERLRKQVTDFAVYSTRDLKHPTNVDAVPSHVVIRNGPGPEFCARTSTYVQALPKQRPGPARIHSFKPFSHSEGLMWEVYDLKTKCCLFRVRGTYMHAYREGERYCTHYGFGPETRVRRHV